MFFRIANGRLISPQGEPFLTLGVNHADSSNIKYPHNLALWQERFRGDQRQWTKAVGRDLLCWGFNTIGWTQEYIGGTWGKALDWSSSPVDLIHSSYPWTKDNHMDVGMPYVVQLRVMEIEDWNGNPKFMDVFSQDFKDWCQYLARAVCVEHSTNPNLLGYFFVDIPSWLPHASGQAFDQGNLAAISERYYQTICEAIKFYDPNHLILGDRYNGNKGIPDPVLRSMSKYVDVLSVQYFVGDTASAREKMIKDIDSWQKICKKPVLVADIGNWTPTQMNPHRIGCSSQYSRGEDYTKILDCFMKQSWFVGMHWCSYMENPARGWGLKDPWDQPYSEMVDQVRDANQRAVETHKSG